MAIDSEIYRSPASKGDVAGVALHAMTALMHARWALEKQASGIDAEDDIAELKKGIDALNESFVALTGWRPDP